MDKEELAREGLRVVKKKEKILIRDYGFVISFKK
jgi:hypothetical protein